MRTTIDIEPGLLKRLRAEAHRRGVSFKAVVNRALHRGLADGPRVRADRYRSPTFAMGTPTRALDKALALAETLEDTEIVRELGLRK